MPSATSKPDCTDVSPFLLWRSAPFSAHTPCFDPDSGTGLVEWSKYWLHLSQKLFPPSCFLSLSLSFTLAQLPSNLPLPLSLTFPFIPSLVLPFFPLPLCPCLSLSLLSRLLRLSVLLGLFFFLSWVRCLCRHHSVEFTISVWRLLYSISLHPDQPLCSPTCYHLKPETYVWVSEHVWDLKVCTAVLVWAAILILKLSF